MPVRRVRRVIRRIDPWTVLKVSLVFNLIVALVVVLGTWVMWSVLVQRGVPDRIADLADSIRLTFTPNGPLYFRIVTLSAFIGAIAATGLATLAAILYNLIADVVGGIEILVLEETHAVPAGGPQRVRPAVHRPTTETAITEADTVPSAVGE
ncbi:MAG TPA: hypothetical protein ENK55_01485 [Actinobacteria bacterium]|nr:hypothetical protein [Actinomycetota bacterium]